LKAKSASCNKAFTVRSQTTGEQALDFDFGAESGTVVSSSGLEVVEAGASASGSVISTGGQLYVAAAAR
jgi:autotransporter passenger strand-loop-strand repeat protein